MANLYDGNPYWGREREYMLDPRPYVSRIPSGYENLITNVRDIKEFTIRAGLSRDNVLRTFGDWMETIFNAIRLLLEINPRFERARITTSYYVLREAANFFNQYTAISVLEAVSAMKEISDWGFSGTDNVFIITDGENVVKTEPVRISPVVLKIEKHEMDEKYPHTCFECGKALQYNHAQLQALSNTEMKRKEFDKLWESENVEFYCCSCYGKKTEPISNFTTGVRVTHTGTDYISW